MIMIIIPQNRVNDANWTYKTTFPTPTPSSTSPPSRTALVFDGLDTIVSVYLNSKLILESRNMHVAHHLDVTDALKLAGGSEENELELRFSNAPEWGRKEMKRIGYKGNGTDVHFGKSLFCFSLMSFAVWFFVAALLVQCSYIYLV